MLGVRSTHSIKLHRLKMNVKPNKIKISRHDLIIQRYNIIKIRREISFSIYQDVSVSITKDKHKSLCNK